MPPQKVLLAQNKLVDEEICPGYDSTKFYLANSGELLANRYQILFKVGWGSSSTVWLARDMRGYYYFHHPTCVYIMNPETNRNLKAL
jgi:hypothetical protein